MARPLRLVASNALYHVTARGNARNAIFRDDDDRRFYLARIAHYRERDGFRVLAYCLMSNHVHLAIETGPVGLPKTMAGLHSSYTQRFNRRHDRVGHLFQGRYHAFVGDRASYGQALIRYIHQNPVEARVVRRDVDYPWSSARAWFRGAGPEWLDLDAGLNLFAASRPRSISNYRLYRSDGGAAAYEEAPIAGQQVRGDEEFAVELFRASSEPPQPWRKASLEKLTREVADAEGLSVEELLGPGQGRSEARARALVAERALAEGRVSLAKTARFFGRDGSTIARAVARLQREREES